MPQSRYEILTTKDESPTLLDRGGPIPEAMHHSGGAWSESLYIYDEALSRRIASFPDHPLRVLSLGLGLGYNELILAAHAENQQIQVTQLWSFESEKLLQSNFTAWLDSRPSEFAPLYEQIQTRCQTRWPRCRPQSFLRNLSQQGLLHWPGPLTENFPSSSEIRANLIFFDAFSKSHTAWLWEENFLNRFLQTYCDDRCVFASYARTGSLKRALEKQGFSIDERSGFHGKRNSTLAVRDRS